MKMESINGGLLPIVKPSDERPDDDDEDDEMLDEEEEPENKKRKITRKKRSLNWEEAERVSLFTGKQNCDAHEICFIYLVAPCGNY